MSTTVRGDFTPLFVPGANKVFLDNYQDLPSFYPQLFNIETSGRAFEDDLVLTGLPLAVRKPEGEDIAFDRPYFRGKVRYIHAGYGLGYEITREMIEDNLYNVITNQGSMNLARSLRETEEISAWSVVNGFFSSTQAYDGVSVINTAHPGVGGLSFANRPAVDQDFSVVAVQALLERFMNLKNDRGLRISMVPKEIWVNPANWWNVNQILRTQFITTTAANDGIASEHTPNIITDAGLVPRQVPYLVDADAWIASVVKAQHKLKFYWRRTPSPADGYEKRSDVGWYGITGRWSAGITDWRGFDGSPGE